jgi:hypothetical protein
MCYNGQAYATSAATLNWNAKGNFLTHDAALRTDLHLPSPLSQDGAARRTAQTLQPLHDSQSRVEAASRLPEL